MTNTSQLMEQASDLADKAAAVSDNAVSLAEGIANLNIRAQQIAQDIVQPTVQVVTDGVDPFVFAVTVFVLSCFIGYYVVWKVTPALHTPLMSVTNAISSIIIIGAILAVGSTFVEISGLYGAIAIFLASINIFGGFVVTHRMLSMFKKKG